MIDPSPRVWLHAFSYAKRSLDKAEMIDRDRRRFLGRTAMTMAAAPFSRLRAEAASVTLGDV
jgi:hypothetical protein